MKNIKNIKYLLTLPVLSILISGCNEEVSNPVFGDTDTPKIFGWAVQNTYSTMHQDTLSIDLIISPNDGATYEWTINGEVISNEKSISYVASDTGVFDVQFTVMRNGVENSRSADLTVNLPITDEFVFEPKEYNKVVIGQLSREGELADINFDNITHLMISSAVVGYVDDETSLVDTSFVDMDIPAIVNAAHLAGVYVVLNVSDNIDPLNGVGVWGELDFYNVTLDEEQRVAAMETIMTFVEDNQFDGINIYLNNTSMNSLNADAVGDYFLDVINYLPEEGPFEYPFIYSASVVGGWTTNNLARLTDAIERLDWVTIEPYRNEDLSPVDHSSMWATTSLADTWIANGVPAEKLVIGFPGFGLRYDMPTDGTEVGWGNLGMFTEYMPFSTLLTLDEDAETKDFLDIDDGIWYDGHTKIGEKATVVIDNGYAGMNMWAIDGDSQNQNKSLLKAAYTALGN